MNDYNKSILDSSSVVVKYNAVEININLSEITNYNLSKERSSYFVYIMVKVRWTIRFRVQNCKSVVTKAPTIETTAAQI